MQPQPQNGFCTGREEMPVLVARLVPAHRSLGEGGSAGTPRNPASHAAGYSDPAEASTGIHQVPIIGRKSAFARRFVVPASAGSNREFPPEGGTTNEAIPHSRLDRSKADLRPDYRTLPIARTVTTDSRREGSLIATSVRGPVT